MARNKDAMEALRLRRQAQNPAYELEVGEPRIGPPAEPYITEQRPYEGTGGPPRIRETADVVGVEVGMPVIHTPYEGTGGPPRIVEQGEDFYPSDMGPPAGGVATQLLTKTVDYDIYFDPDTEQFYGVDKSRRVFPLSMQRGPDFPE